MIDQLTIGQKIKEYRQRAGLSQFQLELEIDASNGSISRIESGKINPTKETLFKISDCLKLSPEETAQLFGIVLSPTQEKIENYEEIKKEFKKQETDPYSFIESIDLETTLDNILNEAEKLGYISPAIYLREPNSEIYQLGKSRASIESFQLAEELLGKSIYELEYTLREQTLPTYTMLTGELQTSTNSFELLFPHLGRMYSLVSKKNIKQSIAIPLKFNNKVIGCITLLSTKLSFFEDEKSNLDQYAQTAAKAIYTAKIKKTIDSKFETEMVEETRLLSNLKEFPTLEDIIKLFKRDFYMQLYAFLFFIILIYWFINQIFSSPHDYSYKIFTHVYFIMSALAGFLGYRTYRLLKGNESEFRRMILILTLIAFSHTLGQIVFTITDYITNYDTPYPSPSEPFYLSATFLSVYLSIYTLQFVRRKIYSNPFTLLNTILFVSFGSLLFTILQIVSFKEYDWLSPNFLATISDIIYGVGQSVAVLISFIGLTILKKSVVSKEISFFLALYFYSSILLYIADFFFTYQTLNSISIYGNIPDLLYFLYYSFLSFGHISLLITIKSQQELSSLTTKYI